MEAATCQPSTAQGRQEPSPRLSSLWSHSHLYSDSLKGFVFYLDTGVITFKTVKNLLISQIVFYKTKCYEEEKWKEGNFPGNFPTQKKILCCL